MVWLAVKHAPALGHWLLLPKRKIEALRRRLARIAELIRSNPHAMEVIHEENRKACIYVASRYKPDLEINKCTEVLDKVAKGELDVTEIEKMLGVKLDWIVEAFRNGRNG